MEEEEWVDVTPTLKRSPSPTLLDSTGPWYEALYHTQLSSLKRLSIHADAQVSSLKAFHRTTTSSTPFAPLIPTPLAAFKPHWLVVRHLTAPQQLDRYVRSLPTYILAPESEQLRIAHLVITHLSAWWHELGLRRVRDQFALINLTPSQLAFCPTTDELWLTAYNFMAV